VQSWLKNIIGLVILGVLLWYLSQRWEQLKSLVKLNLSELLLLYICTGLATVSNCKVNQRLLRVLGARIGLWELVLLQNAMRLLNLMPMKFGTVVRGNYMKRHHSVSYTNYVTFFLFFTFLMAAAAAVIGLVGVGVVYKFGSYETNILGLFFIFLLAAAALFLFAPLPTPKSDGKWMRALRGFLQARMDIAKNKKVILANLCFLLLTFSLTAVRLGIIFHSIGKDIHPVGYLILGALGFASLIISITPASLGVRELVIGVGAVGLGVPLEVGLLVAMFDRAIMLSWTFVIGGLCALWLWRKYPADFKKNKYCDEQVKKVGKNLKDTKNGFSSRQIPSS